MRNGINIKNIIKKRNTFYLFTHLVFFKTPLFEKISFLLEEKLEFALRNKEKVSEMIS